jgi:type I restriction enzyme M protein
LSKDFKQTLWKTADKLRAQMDAAEYKHIVLGLIFVKYISDTFVKQQDKVEQMVSEPSSDYFISDIPEEYAAELEDRDYFTQDNVFWVPQEARWETLRSKAKQPDIGSIIDDAMTAIENENRSLRGKLDKRFGRAQLGQGVLGELIDLISTIGFADKYDSSDLLGEVYEYFLGQFASAEGKKGGQFYTPSHVVKTLVAVLSPNSGRVYDPCCGSGGMFVQSEEFVKAHGGRVDDISIYGQESNPTTWRLAAMNLAIRGFAADLGEEPADTFARDQFPDVKFDYIMANPPFNISDWGGEKYESDPRWQFGRPPVGNANYAWLQHMLWKLRPGGQAGVVLANGSMSSNTGGEGQIREAMVRGDVVEVMVALPGQLFLNTQIPVCLWFLTNDKTMNGRDRRGETLFIDARQLGTMETRVLKVFTDEDIEKIQETVQSWKTGEGYEDVAGFCKSASLEEIEKNNFVLTPGRYVGAAESEEDGVDFGEKFARLKDELKSLKTNGMALDKEIDRSLHALVMERD